MQMLRLTLLTCFGPVLRDITRSGIDGPHPRFSRAAHNSAYTSNMERSNSSRNSRFDGRSRSRGAFGNGRTDSPSPISNDPPAMSTPVVLGSSRVDGFVRIVIRISIRCMCYGRQGAEQTHERNLDQDRRPWSRDDRAQGLWGQSDTG